ncbi:MAG: metallophosphoesterase [Thermoprotei archaeon]|nr:metallophosphoesterase [Thermoprotei archaeon]
MRIGLMADTHDNVHMVDKAVKVFNEYEVSLVLHAGDIVSPFVPRWFKGLRCKLIGVFGNNENERRMLVERFGKMGHELRGHFTVINVGGKRIALLHGHEAELLDFTISSGYFDYVVYGHTHEVRLEEVRGTLVINPGETCGYLSGRATIALLEPLTGEVKIYDLK